MEDTTDAPLCSRRTVLQTLAVGVPTVLAGCSSNRTTDSQSPPASEKTTTDQGDALQDVHVDGTELSVSVTDEADVAAVTVIDPAGKTFGSKDVPPGARQISFDLLPEYTPGEYRVVAADDVGVLDERLVTLEPNVEIVEVGVAQNHPEKNWEKTSSNWELNAFATVQNTGTAPQVVTNLQFSGTPQPTTKYGFEEMRISGETRNEYALTPGKTVTIYSITEPFQPVERSCESTTMEVIVKTGIGPDVLASYNVTMTGSSLVENCTITIQRGK